jgi:hypothetical protein
VWHRVDNIGAVTALERKELGSGVSERAQFNSDVLNTSGTSRVTNSLFAKTKVVSQVRRLRYVLLLFKRANK